MNLGERAVVGHEAARAGGDVAAHLFRESLSVETKDGKTDVVIRADWETQATVVDRIRESFPGETVVGEEDAADR